MNLLRRIYRKALPTTIRSHIGAARGALRAACRFIVGYGFYNSLLSDAPVDRTGNDLPWYTYPAIEFLDQLDLSGRSVFEFGAGHSTVFWAKRANRVVAVEHNEEWYDHLSSLSILNRQNVTIQFRRDLDEYARTILDHHELFDVIVIDGSDRLGCARVSPERLKPGGLIVLDNSDSYLEVAQLLRNQGRVQIDFAGFGPQNLVAWRTSVFIEGNITLPRRTDILLDSKQEIPYENDIRREVRTVYLTS